MRAKRRIYHVPHDRRTYRAWHDMIEKKEKGFIVEEGLCDFEKFLEAMGSRPEGKSLRLRDPDIGYLRENLIWGPERKQKPRSCVVAGRKREHNSWKNMMVRTYYDSHERHQKYVEIGCFVEDFLQDFENFFAYMGPRPPGTSLDRIDPWGPYMRGNLRWATPAQQNTNQRRFQQWKAQTSIGIFLLPPEEVA